VACDIHTKCNGEKGNVGSIVEHGVDTDGSQRKTGGVQAAQGIRRPEAVGLVLAAVHVASH
jgi:hypothetical protein